MGELVDGISDVPSCAERCASEDFWYFFRSVDPLFFWQAMAFWQPMGAIPPPHRGVGFASMRTSDRSRCYDPCRPPRSQVAALCRAVSHRSIHVTELRIDPA